MAKFVKKVLMFCAVCMEAAIVESQTGNCSDSTVITWKHNRPELMVLDNGTLTTYNCTRPCSDDVQWCLKEETIPAETILRRDRDYVLDYKGSTDGMPGVEGNCTLTITILALEEIDGDLLYCASDCENCEYFLFSLTTPYVLHVRGPSPSPTCPHPTDNTPGTITITTTVSSSVSISSQGPPSPSPTCPTVSPSPTCLHPTDNTPGTITITTTVSSSIPISSQELSTTLTAKSSTLVPSPSQTCITEFGKVVTCGANRALPGVVVIAIGFLAAIIVRLL